MKSIISSVFISVLFSCFAFTANAAQKKDVIEQWRIYSDAEIKNPYLAAVLYSSEGEDAALGVRCEKQRPELYFMFGDQLPAQINSAFLMKADGAELESGKWQRASNGNGAFALKPSALLNQLAEKQGLILTYKTAQGKYKVAGFHLAGLSQLKQMMENVCQINLRN